VDAVDSARLDRPDVQVTDIYKAIGSLKSRATNYDRISANAIKDCEDSLAHALTKLIKLPLKENTYRLT
jgi:hypothetical protein